MLGRVWFRYDSYHYNHRAHEVAMSPLFVRFASPFAAPGEEQEREKHAKECMRGERQEHTRSARYMPVIVCVPHCVRLWGMCVAEGRPFRSCLGSRGVTS